MIVRLTEKMTPSQVTQVLVTVAEDSRNFPVEVYDSMTRETTFCEQEGDLISVAMKYI